MAPNYELHSRLDIGAIYRNSVMKEHSCPCPNCGKPKYFARHVRKKNREDFCRQCREESGKPSHTKVKYTRTCASCGDTKEVGYKPKGTERCPSCAKREDAKDRAETRYKNYLAKRHYYFCPKCPSVRELTAKRKTSLCGVCSRKYSKGEQPKQEYYDMKTLKLPKMRYFAVCSHCGDTRQVQQAALGGVVSCLKCKYLDKTKEEREAITKKRVDSLKATCKARPKKRKKSNMPSKEAIAKAREISRTHRKAVKKPKPIPQAKTEKQMMKEWLKNNKVTVIDTSHHTEWSSGRKGCNEGL